MAAVAGRGEVPRGGLVAAELGEPVTSVSYLRARLLRKGTIYRVAGGAMHFITPGMGAVDPHARSGRLTGPHPHLGGQMTPGRALAPRAFGRV